MFGEPAAHQTNATTDVKNALEHFYLADCTFNVKVLSNIYLKNLRFLPFDPETAITNLKKILTLSEWLCGREIQYKVSQIHMEIGKTLSVSLGDKKKGRAHIEKGRMVLEGMYSADHPIYSKYLAFISL